MSLQKIFQSKQPTGIEKTLYDYLLLKGIIFETQKIINGRFIVDAYIPSLNLVIEADGKYWHTAENAYLTKCGYKLLRLTEEEINNGNFKERLVD
jgi:very-short-patch-repair endonuclease